MSDTDPAPRVVRTRTNPDMERYVQCHRALVEIYKLARAEAHTELAYDITGIMGDLVPWLVRDIREECM